MLAEAAIYFVFWWVLFEYSSFDYFPKRSLKLLEGKMALKFSCISEKVESRLPKFKEKSKGRFSFYIRILFFPVQAKYPYFSALEGTEFPFYNVLGYPSVWCPYLYRTVISIEHLTSAGFWCRFVVQPRVYS